MTVPALRKLRVAGPSAFRRGMRGGWHLARRGISRALPVVVFGLAGLILANGVLTLSPAKVISTVLTLVGLGVFFRRVELGVLVLIMVSATIMYESMIPKPFTVGHMGFSVAEILVLYLCSLVLLHTGSEKRMNYFDSPLTTPFVLLGFAILLSLAVGYYGYLSDPRTSTWSFTGSYNAARPLFLYLLFFVVGFGVKDAKKLRFLVNAVIVLATIVAVLLVVQYFLGTHVKVFFGTPYSGPRVESLEEGSSVTRSIPPGTSLMYIFLPVVSIMACIGKKRERLLYGAASLICAVGLMFTFTRNLWAAVFVSFVLLLWTAGRQIRRKLIVVGVPMLLCAVLLGVAIGNLAPGAAGEFGKAFISRLESVFESGILKNASLQHRMSENRSVLRVIRENPIFGIGLGNPVRYQAVTGPNNRQAIVPTSIIHNSYLELYAVHGLFGVISYAWLIIAVLIRGVQGYRCLRDPFHRALALGLTVACPAYLISAFVAMILLHDIPTIIAIAFAWGVVEAAIRVEREQAGEREASPQQIGSVSALGEMK